MLVITDAMILQSVDFAVFLDRQFCAGRQFTGRSA